MASLVVAALVFVAALVVELAALALVPATASAAPNPVTAYVTKLNSGTVTPIAVAPNTPGNPIPAGSTPLGIAITPTPRATSTSTHLSANPLPPLFGHPVTPHTAPFAQGV